MGYTKPTGCTAEDLSAIQYPKHGKTYTIIRHKFLIDASRSILKTHGFNIKNEEYKATANGNIAQGIYKIESDKDSELGMMFAWSNSYDKSTRFQCGIGAYVMVCDNGMVCGDMASYARKHTGNADQEAFNHIMSQTKQGDKYFTQLINDRDGFKNCILSKKEQSELVGRLFIDEELIDSSQASCIKNEMIKPSYNYQCNMNNAWAFYNHVTHALKKSHPRSWMTDQQKFHKFMVSELVSMSALKPNDSTNVHIDDHEIMLPDGRIIDELDAAEPMNEMVQNDFDADMEAQDYDMFGEDKI